MISGVVNDGYLSYDDKANKCEMDHFVEYLQKCTFIVIVVVVVAVAVAVAVFVLYKNP